jgi:hypothetical protein
LTALMILDRCTALLAKDIACTQRSGVAEMTSIVEQLPVGWSLVDDRGRWQIYDDDGELICVADDTDHLRKLLEIEFALAKAFASWIHATKYTQPAEA